MFTNKIKEIRSLNEKEWFNTRADATVVGPLAEKMEDTNNMHLGEGEIPIYKNWWKLVEMLEV